MKRNLFCQLSQAIAPLTGFGILLSAITCSAYAQVQPVCDALVNSNNQLYLVAANGTLISQFPTDNQDKSSISFAPDGSKVAYISAASPDVFTVTDTAGHIVTYPVKKSAQGPFTGISWDSPSVLKVQYHASPDNNVFQFFSVPATVTHPLRPIGAPVGGANCAAQTGNDNQIACISENKLVRGKKILVDQDPLASGNVAVFASATMTVGTTFITQTIPSFQVRVLSITDGVTLQITLPDGSWAQSSIPTGSALPVNWDDNIYGFTPISIDSGKAQVTIKMTKTNGQANVFDRALTWSPSNDIAVVTHGVAGAQLLVVKPSGNQAPMVADLGPIEQVTSMNYNTPNLLMLRTRSRFIPVPVNSFNGSTSSLQTGTLGNLPTKIDVTLPGGVTSASVEGWACH
jgi:hypothetical protein